MSSRFSVIVPLLVTVLVALTVLAYASPADPTYISGFWDDGDYDDVVNLATSACSILIHLGYEFASVRLVLPVPSLHHPLISFRSFSPRAPRAPPAA
jgi:hypothetical protein